MSGAQLNFKKSMNHPLMTLSEGELNVRLCVHRYVDIALHEKQR